MFSTSTFISLVSLSLLSTLTGASPIQSRQEGRPCADVKAGALCKLNGSNPGNVTALSNYFSFDVRGKQGTNSAIDFLSLDFQLAEKQDDGSYLGQRKFHVVEYDIEANTAKVPDFHYAHVKTPCGLSGKTAFINVSSRGPMRGKDGKISERRRLLKLSS